MFRRKAKQMSFGPEGDPITVPRNPVAPHEPIQQGAEPTGPQGEPVVVHQGGEVEAPTPGQFVEVEPGEPDPNLAQPIVGDAEPLPDGTAPDARITEARKMLTTWEDRAATTLRNGKYAEGYIEAIYGCISDMRGVLGERD